MIMSSDQSSSSLTKNVEQLHKRLRKTEQSIHDLEQLAQRYTYAKSVFFAGFSKCIAPLTNVKLLKNA